MCPRCHRHHTSQLVGGLICTATRCEIGRAMQIAHRARRRFGDSRTIDVETWCRKCGNHALLKLDRNYRKCVNYLRQLDTFPMQHEDGNHQEQNGWGYLWRLDEVLSKAFRAEYDRDSLKPYWPRTPFNQHLCESDYRPIGISIKVYDYQSPVNMENFRRKVERHLNDSPVSRHDLESRGKEVWNDAEVRESFELLGSVGPFALAIRLRDGCRGSLVCQKNPKLYFDFDEGRRVL